MYVRTNEGLVKNRRDRRSSQVSVGGSTWKKKKKKKKKKKDLFFAPFLCSLVKHTHVQPDKEKVFVGDLWVAWILLRFPPTSCPPSPLSLTF